MTEKKKIFFFDFDGVILDTVALKGEAFKEVYSSEMKCLQEKVLNYHNENGGVSRVDKFQFWEKEIFKRDLTSDRIDYLCKLFNTIVLDKVKAAREIAGATQFVQSLNPKNCYVITGTPHEEIGIILRERGLCDLFCEFYGYPYEKSSVMKEIMNKRKLQPLDCVMFGDSMTDYLASKAAEIDFIGINPSKELRKQRDIISYKDFNEFN